MSKQIPLSFKDNEQDLHNFLKEKSSPSAYVKELLKIAKEVEKRGGNIYSIKENDNCKKDNNIKETKTKNTINLSTLNIGK